MFIFRFRKSKKGKGGSKNKSDSNSDDNKQTYSSNNQDQLFNGLSKTPKKRTRKIEQFKRFCKKTTTFLFSRVGLCFLCFGYVAIGGFIFKSIEGSNEEQKIANKTLINDVVNMRTDNLVNEIWNMTKFEKVFHEKNYTNKLKGKLLEYQKNLTDAVKEGYKGNSNHNTTKWTYLGSILYSVTIVTTIGIFLFNLKLNF